MEGRIIIVRQRTYTRAIICDVLLHFCCRPGQSLEAFASLLFLESLASWTTDDRLPIVIRARDTKYFRNLSSMRMLNWHTLYTHSARCGYTIAETKGCDIVNTQQYRKNIRAIIYIIYFQISKFKYRQTAEEANRRNAQVVDRREAPIVRYGRTA